MVTALQKKVSSQTGQSLAPAVAAVLTPIVYLSYVLLIRWLQGHPLKVEPLLSTGMFLYFLVLALTGIIAALSWDWGLRGTPIIAVGGLLLWPWVYLSIPIGNVGYASVPFAGVLLATLVEGVIRYPERLEQLSTGSVGRYALVAGLVHFLLGFGLQIYARRFYWMDFSFTGRLLMGVVYLVSGLALVATGAASVILWKRRRLITPSLVTAGWFLWGLYGTWQMRGSLPWGHFEGINWISLRPYPDYMLQWTVLMIALLVLAGSELMTRKMGQYLIDTWTTSTG